MKINNTNKIIEYSCSQSFRNLYHQNTLNNQPIQQKQISTINNNKLTLEYQSIQSPNNQSKCHQSSPHKSTIQHSNQQFTLKKYSQRLYSNHRKYSFSGFVQKQKNSQLSISNNQSISSHKKLLAKSPTKTVSPLKQQFQNKKNFKGIKQFNNHAIKTFYQNFKNHPTRPIQKSSNQQNYNTLTILSQREYQKLQNDTQNYMSKTSRVPYQSQQYSEEINPTINQKHFFNTISYGEKFMAKSHSISRQKQLSKFTHSLKPKQSPKNSSYLQLCPQQLYTEYNDTFLKIEKCQIEKKDQNFIKDCYDFKQILLKEQQKRQRKKKQAQRKNQKQTQILMLLNKNKRQLKFFESPDTKGKEVHNKYVSEMREKKKIKNNYMKSDEHSGNEIEPW